ncbi:hypothetical protein ATANTOWER_017979 [Ataeniobius toweri]|uniref:Uncharacterized protein n=1 Tax=Ataeniobius toweri TaxID=208326 RepID=A0ABU7AZ43_9TELE|nr:hypothetical protein [Ataeniobius toweri]
MKYKRFERSPPTLPAPCRSPPSLNDGADLAGKETSTQHLPTRPSLLCVTCGASSQKPSGTTTILTWIEERSAERHDRRSGWSQENKAEAASSSRSRRARQTTAGSCDQSIFYLHDHLPAEALLIHGSTTRRLGEGVALWFPVYN